MAVIDINGERIDVNATLRLIEIAEAEESLATFIQQSWHVIEPGQPYVHGWHIDFLCEHLEAITRGEIINGRTYNRLLANVPPGPGWVENKVTTSTGRIRLGDLKAGDMVLTHRGRYRPVTACYPKGRLPTLRIVTKSGRETIATPDHNFLTPNGWVEAGRLNVGDTLAYVTPAEDISTPLMSPEEARLLGYLVGDGSITHAPSFTNSDEDTVADFELCAQSMGFKTSKKRVRNTWRVAISGAMPWLEQRGLRGKSSQDKFIPNEVLASGTFIIKNFIGAYWSCDGMIEARSTRSRGSRYRANATTVSERLAFDLIHALSRIGIRSCLRRKARPLETQSQPGGIYRSFSIEVYGEADTARFIDMPGLCNRKNELAKKCQDFRFDSVLNEDKIVLIEDAGERECMCVSIDEDHSLVWDDIVVHNTMKSLIVNVFWPAWEWGPQNMPHMRYVCAAHKVENLSARDSRRMRQLVTSDWYLQRWGDRVSLSKDQNEKLNFHNDQGGFRIATAITSLTGIRGDRVIIDDPHSVDSAASETQREAEVTTFLEAIPTRLNNPETSAIVVIMQRLHEEDISGVILDKGLDYDHVMLPMRYDPARAQPTKLGYEDPREEDGELLFPERFPLHVVERDEKAMGPYACNPAEAPVLMSDLSMKPISEVRVGDELIGFGQRQRLDEKEGRMTLMPATVLQVNRRKASVVKMTLDSGEVIRCTSDHRWFRKARQDRDWYGPATIGSKLARVCPPRLPSLSAEDERLAGWLSGFFDGEGTVTNCEKRFMDGGYRPSSSIIFYQGAGRNLPLCEKLERALTYFGFSYRCSEDERKPNKDAPCYGYRAYRLTGISLPVMQRFLHVVQPTKWRDRIMKAPIGARFIQGREKVVSIEPDGEEDVFSLTTTTGNYVVWGLMSSNCAGQFQQEPTPRGGGVIKREWWTLWEGAAFPPVDYVIAALDTAYTTKSSNDFSALTIWGVFTGGDQKAQATRSVSVDGDLVSMVRRTYTEEHPRLILMHAWQHRLELHELVLRVAESMKKMSVDKLLIENKASGYSVAQELRRMFGHEDWGVQLVDPKGQDKLARLYSVQHLFAEGLIYAPDRVWADMVINQCSVFPKGKHDDLVDTVSMAVRHIRETGMLVRSPEHIARVEDQMAHAGGPPVPLYGV